MRISDWSSDVCSSDLDSAAGPAGERQQPGGVLLHHREADLRRLAGLAFQEGARDEAHEVAIAGLVLHQEDELVGRRRGAVARLAGLSRSEEHTSELQSLMRISYAVFCLKKKTTKIEIARTERRQSN